MSTTNASDTTSAAETDARCLIASAAWAAGHFSLDLNVAEMVRAGASPSAIVSATWETMCSKLDAKAALSHIGPTYGGVA